MNWLIIAIILVSIFLAVELVRHLLIRKISTTIIVSAIVLIMLLIISSYAVQKNTDNKLLITGSTILDSLKNLKDNFNVGDLKKDIFDDETDDIIKKTENINRNILTKIKTIKD